MKVFPELSDKENKRIVLYLVAAAAILGIALYFSPSARYGRQVSRNLDLAEKYIRRVQPVLLKDSRFSNIELQCYWKEHSPLHAHGFVKDEKDFDELAVFFEKTGSPVNIRILAVAAPELF